jgi:hypothetical protein
VRSADADDAVIDDRVRDLLGFIRCVRNRADGRRMPCERTCAWPR